jgi:hypothetical protein
VLCSAAAVVVAVSVMVVLAALSEDQVTRANYDRIKIGMSREEVKAILGWSGSISFTIGCGPSIDEVVRPTQHWSRATYIISVEFGGDTVVAKGIEYKLLRRIRDWLSL